MELPAGLVDTLGLEPVEESDLTSGQREAVAECRQRCAAVRVVRFDLPLTVACLFDPESHELELVPLE